MSLGLSQKSFLLKEIVALLGGKIIGDTSTKIMGVASLKSAGPGDLAFFSDERLKTDLEATKAGVIILGEVHDNLTSLPKIITENPHLYFARACNLLIRSEEKRQGISEYAAVSSTAKISPESYIGAQAIIESHVVIKDRVTVGAGCYIGKNVTIEKGTYIFPNATICSNSLIGQNVIIHSGAVIGADGFGLAKDQREWVKIPQIGRVIIGDDCEVGANTTIDRGALDDTILCNGVKLDNQIQIGHNCEIGENTAIAGQVGIAGSTKIGSNCQIGGGALVTGHLEIVSGTVISAGTLIFKSLKTPGRYTGAFPLENLISSSQNLKVFK